MAEGFGTVMGQRLLYWSGWFFTVFGVVVSLYLSKEHAWIASMVAVAGLIPLGTHAWWVHKKLAATEAAHQSEVVTLRQHHQEQVTLREQAERRLAEVPAEALSRLAGLVNEGVVSELVALLRLQADMIGRLRQFSTALTKPLNVRAFQQLQGELYVVVRGLPAAIAHLRPGDPFDLIRRSESGVEITAAKLVLHQPIGAGSDIATFRAVESVADDIAHLRGLAGNQAVEGIKGYTLVLAVQLAGIPALDFAQVAEAIPHLALGLTRTRGV